jgi:heme/copper-type cytochrome/quinol oxidase subunit 2
VIHIDGSLGKIEASNTSDNAQILQSRYCLTRTHMRQSHLTILAGAVFILILLGFSISVMVIYSDGRAYTSANSECPVYPNITSAVAKKQLSSQWHWTYKFNEFDGRIQQNCPSQMHDTELYVNDDLVARSDGKLFSTKSKVYINDCHGDRIYTMEAGDVWDAIINSFHIEVSFLLWNADMSEILGYAKGRSWFNDDFEILNTDGQPVASMHRKLFEIPRRWEFHRIVLNAPGADFRVLGIIAGTHAFSDGDDTDMCNSYFYNLSIVLITIWSVILAIILFVILYFCWGIKECMSSYHRHRILSSNSILPE